MIRSINVDRLRRGLAAVLLIAALVQGTPAVAMIAKGWLAGVLINMAWQHGITSKQVTKPWPWADIVPVARLQVPKYDIDQIVLSDVSGEALAFGPGMVVGTGDTGMTRLISGHRDSYFGFLEMLRVDDEIRLTMADGVKQIFRVTSTDIVDRRDVTISVSGTNLLVLSTCYPFGRLQPRGDLRYLVSAVPQGHI
ncbi:MAG: hypothetical protein DHS20C01_08440 [marine bacterium B5-7]|nr:MAG: hypothetical protein DHS20C01_08440 [marine bacterium B5-7]